MSSHTSCIENSYLIENTRLSHSRIKQTPHRSLLLKVLHPLKLSPALSLTAHQQMETESLIPKPTYGGIKRYLRRRQYQRLDGTAGRKKTKIIRLRGSPRRYWRIKPIAKLRWVVKSPLKVLAKLKNTYVDFMLRLTGNADPFFGGKRIPKARQVSNGYSGDTFEARLIYEISKVLIASRELNSM